MAKFFKAHNCVNCVKKSIIFSHLTRDELELIDNNRYEVNYNPGEIIFKQGTPCNHVVSFVSGLGKVYIEGLNDKNLILKIIKPVEFISSSGMYVDDRHHFTVRTIERSMACFIDQNIFKQVLRENKDFMEAFIKDLNINGIFAFERLINLNQKQRQGRIAEALLYLSESVFNSNPFDIKLSKKEIGELTAMSRESAFRIIKEFKEAGIIAVDQNIIHILNKELLSEISVKG